MGLMYKASGQTITFMFTLHIYSLCLAYYHLSEITPINNFNQKNPILVYGNSA